MSTLPRQIKLNKTIRTAIVDNVIYAWKAENERPLVPPTSRQNELQKLMAWKADLETVKLQVAGALDTFSSVNQLEEVWPTLLPFVPGWAKDPERFLSLPKAKSNDLNSKNR